MQRTSAVLLSAVLALGTIGATATAQGSPARPQTAKARTAHAAYTPPPIVWHACDDPGLASAGAQCGDLVVPLNYARPTGTKITVALSRVRHTVDATHYQGVMIVNPGGPGGSGLGLSTLGQYVPDNVGADYDWIGFDPRGVGSSVPSLSCNAKIFHPDRPPYDITKYPSRAAWINRSKIYADVCTHAKGNALFNHVKTRDNARDLESMRIALGADQINYYGFSYGTYLGQVYATMYPSRVRRFVFDGTVDPRRAFYLSNQDQDRAFQKTFDIYFRWLAKYHSVYHVGNTFAEVRARWLATRDKLDKHAAGGVLGGDELIDVFTSAGYYVFGWESIAQEYSAYINGGDPSALIADYEGSNPTTPGSDNGYAIYLGTQCTDNRWPHSQADLDRDNTRLNIKYSYFTWSNAWFNGPCAYWHYPAATPTAVTGANVHSKILMINETYDAATPYPGSLYVRKIFPTASLVEGKDGSTHAGSLFGVACTDNTIARYLATGDTPTRRSGSKADKVCPPNAQPNPTADAAAPAARTSAAQRQQAAGRLRIQAILAAAQVHR